MFDEKNIAMRFAVISDVHISYTEYSAADIVDKLNGYASAIADLRDLSGGNLDAVMMCGDYSSIGCREQAMTFAQSTRVIFNTVFGKDKMPKLLIGMGNHDTCWRQKHYYSMHADEWYNIFGNYGLTRDFSDKSDRGNGNIRMDVEKDGGRYSFLYVETEDYNPNIFKEETLKWLDTMLQEITAENSDRYVFVGIHGPIAETKIYGTVKKLEPGADWGTSRDNINKIISKYPQTVVFSGHTHMSAELETTIMQTNYTAINVPPVLTRCYYNSGEQDFIDGKYASYLDNTYPDYQHGMGMYLELDNCGNMRIRRVNFTRNRAKVFTKNIWEKENPAVGTWPGEPDRFIYLELQSCKITDGEKPAFFLPEWILDTPDETGEFLKRYTEERGKGKAPYFPVKLYPVGNSVKNVSTGESKNISENKDNNVNKCVYNAANKNAMNAISTDKNSHIRIQFPAAICERYILYYKIIISTGDADKEFRVLGNWVDIRKGVLKGNTHKDATYFEYELPPVVNDDDPYKIQVIAVDEYGNESEPLTVPNI